MKTNIKYSRKNYAAVFIVCMSVVLGFSGCAEKAEKQPSGKAGLVTMSVALTEDDRTTLNCTVFNKTSKDIVIGEAYSLQVLKDKAFVDVSTLPDAGAFNLQSINILSGNDYSYRAYIEDNYGKLESGHYRIVQEYTNKEKGSTGKESKSKETVSAEFDLP